MEHRVRRTGVKVTPTTVFRASLGHRRPGLKYKDYKDQSSSKAEYTSSCVFITSNDHDKLAIHSAAPTRLSGATALVSLLRVFGVKSQTQQQQLYSQPSLK